MKMVTRSNRAFPPVNSDVLDVDQAVAVVREALVVEATYIELFIVVENALCAGNGGVNVDDALDAALTRLVDGGTVEYTEEQPEPGMLSRCTYCLTQEG